MVQYLKNRTTMNTKICVETVIYLLLYILYALLHTLHLEAVSRGCSTNNVFLKVPVLKCLFQ